MNGKADRGWCGCATAEIVLLVRGRFQQRRAARKLLDQSENESSRPTDRRQGALNCAAEVASGNEDIAPFALDKPKASRVDPNDTLNRLALFLIH